MKTITTMSVVAILMMAIALRGAESSDKEEIKIFWKNWNDGLKVAIVSDQTVAYTDQEVSLSLLIHNPTEKAIRVPALDRYNIRCHDGIRFDRVKGRPSDDIGWQTLDAGGTGIYSVHHTWKKPGAYDAYFATDPGWHHRGLVDDQLTTLKHTITVLKREG